MADISEKLSHSSFRQKGSEELDKAMQLLRRVKYRFGLCGESCFSKPEVKLEDWQEARKPCLTDCQAIHDSIFSEFIQGYMRIRDRCVKCAYACAAEYPVSKFGEEDMRICEEKCYETYNEELKETNVRLHQKYEQVYLEKFKPE